MNLREFSDKVSSFDFEKVYGGLIDDKAVDILEMNRDQLMEGKSSEGKDLRPYYSEDPWFKKPGAAIRYAAWKQRITPNPLRKRDVPNLFINGRYHSNFFFKRNGTEFEVGSKDPNSSKIEPKYAHIHTLTPENCIKLGNEIMPDILGEFIKKIL